MYTSPWEGITYPYLAPFKNIYMYTHILKSILSVSTTIVTYCPKLHLLLKKIMHGSAKPEDLETCNYQTKQIAKFYEEICGAVIKITL